MEHADGINLLVPLSGGRGSNGGYFICDGSWIV